MGSQAHYTNEERTRDKIGPDRDVILEKEGGNTYPDGDGEDSEDAQKEDEMQTELSMEDLKEAFRLFDGLELGYITVIRFREIHQSCGDDFTEEEIEGMIIDTDLDKSDTIDFDEFVKLMA